MVFVIGGQVPGTNIDLGYKTTIGISVLLVLLSFGMLLYRRHKHVKKIINIINSLTPSIELITI